MFNIDLFICRPEYWLMIYRVEKCWQFSLYFPSKKLYCNADNFCYSTRLGCLNSAKEVAANFILQIYEL